MDDSWRMEASITPRNHAERVINHCHDRAATHFWPQVCQRPAQNTTPPFPVEYLRRVVRVRVIGDTTEILHENQK